MKPFIRALFAIAALLLIGAGFRNPPEQAILLWLAAVGVLSLPRLMGDDDKS